MDKDRKFVIDRLFTIRKNHLKYFIDNNCKILACLSVNWEKPISAHVTNKNLPFEIASDIEGMFWVVPDKLDELNVIMMEINLRVEKSKKLSLDFNRLCDNLKQAHKKQIAVFERIYGYD